MLMKNLYIIFISLAILSFLYTNTYSQCTPDVNCIDTDDPGEICPEALPNGVLNMPYNTVVTFIPPATADLGNGSVSIFKIKITEVLNLPPGLTWETNPANAEFIVTNPITRGCALVSGTPTVAGTYPLTIKVLPYLNIFNTPVPATLQVDSTSLSITILPTANISANKVNSFYVLDPKPNPFTLNTKIGFYSPIASVYNLYVYDVLGNPIHFESKKANKGENYFEFLGSNLSKGVYFYTIQSSREKITKQLIKQ